MKNLLKITFTLIFTTILLLGFAMPLNPAGNWYQQFMPNIGGAQISDITFTDSLNGYAITNLRTANDSAFILKTSNSGDTWNIIYRNNRSFVKVKFINSTTGFTNSFTTIFKTTNSGLNWTPILLPGIFGDDMAVLNDSIIYLAMSESLTGGVFRTTNGGVNWQQQLNIGSSNPDHIYMYNFNLGFIGKYGGSYLRRTTDGGVNWTVVESGGFNGFSDMFFVNSLTGFRSISIVKKTTDGGISWINQVLPQGGQIITSTISKISGLNKDTLWGIGGEILINSQTRGIIYRTINGGLNWQFQIPDTAINVPGPYNYLHFTNSRNGWAYTLGFYGGIHTTTGGDPLWITGIEQISTEVPQEFNLYQNYPNPFNPTTKINFEIPLLRGVSGEGGRGVLTLLMIYNSLGQEVTTLVNQQLSPGIYSVDWNASNYPSGIYFCRLTSGDFSAVNKMILVK